MTIWFDMDGTIADLYGVDNWLDMLIAEDETPYAIAKPMLNMNGLARQLNALRRKGYKIGIISWLSKTSTPEYDLKVTNAKLKWLNEHLASVAFDEIKIVAYGTNKWNACKSGILFDDEERNRIAWKATAFEPHRITEVLSALNHERPIK